MTLTCEYFLFVFVASIGVLQLAAALAHLKGLLFFRRAVCAYIFTIVAIGGAFGFFFGWDSRLDTVMRHVGLEGRQQFFYFNLAAFAALVFTLIFSSLLKFRQWKRESKGTSQGLGALKEMSYFEAIKHSFRSKEK